MKYIILYGSRARGDNREDSDYDIMILVDDLDDLALNELDDKRLDIDCEYDRIYDIYLMPIVRNVGHFNKWVRALPFYNNVWNEGVALYDAEAEVG